ncbi:MAG: tRNA adenosine(34) deaminase TadA [Thermodesulfobacteriota bacterium]
MDPEETKRYMGLALEKAREAAEADEVPVGAVLVMPERGVVAAARNRVIADCDPTSHAEMLALRAAARAVGNYRLTGGALFVTVEPCPMCMGAVIHARLSLLVYGAPDPKWGAAGSLYSLHQDERLNHRVDVLSGIMESRCAELLRSFFSAKRALRKNDAQV